MAIFALILAILFFIAGLAGSVLPVLPGAILIWLGMLIYGILTKFTTLNALFFVGQGLAVATTYSVDYFAGILGVKRFGGSRAAGYGSIAGTIVGMIFWGPAGLIFGPFIGAIAGEILSNKPLDRAIRSGWGTLIGLFGGTIAKLIIEILMIIWFFWAIYH
ncbi:DUF456 domain-containing protein [Desulfotruncus alcoholivorax]|uniref:DUF456 domain-containing protein n=1 Tax=Desulfotruncus alcoholivorax TaxID=265477 RepID=UPI00041FA9D4|nr:DUF456 family protein [Desulfotruncus alcoholivorax]